MSQAETIFNPMLLELTTHALRKRGFVDSAMAAGGGAPPAGGDPAAMGGMPPGGGAPPMDPSMGGGMPPADPSMGGGPDIATMIQQAVSQAMASQGGGMGGAGAGASGMAGPPKLKVDINVEIVQMKKMLAKIIDALGIPVPAQEMAIDQNDVQQMAQEQATGAQPASAIQPIGPIQPAMPGGGGGASKQGRWEQNGAPYGGNDLAQMSQKAAALGDVFRRRKRSA